MAKKIFSKNEIRRRKEIITAVKSHINSLLVGFTKFKNGSNAESRYLEEHYERLGWYINEAKQLMGEFYIWGR